MATLALVFPVLPGKSDEGRRFAQELMTSRASELQDFFKRVGITKERWYVQEVPQGELVVVYMEAVDPERALREWAASDHPFDRWWKQTAGAICGIDFNQPPPRFPEQILEWPMA